MGLKYVLRLWPLLFFLVTTDINAAEVVGRKAAERYLQGRGAAAEGDYQALEGTSAEEPASFSRYGSEVLMLSLGSFIESRSYFWTDRELESIGRANYGVTYLFDQWQGMDRSLRVEFAEFRVGNESPRKLSFMPLITFPRANTRFPLYFGIGAGLGVFTSQIAGESDVSFDYQLVTGLRFFDVFNSTGFFLELGMKNHFHILSDGQYNGNALNGGMLFTF